MTNSPSGPPLTSRRDDDDDPIPFAQSLPLPATGSEVAQFVASRAAACVGAEHSSVALLQPGSDTLRMFHGSSLDRRIAGRYTDVALTAPFPLPAAVRDGRPVLLPDLVAYSGQFPDIVDDTVAAGVQASASVPLHRADGSVLGAIGFAWAAPVQFEPKVEAALVAVAHLCVETIERAERYDAEHQLVAELQIRLLGDVPSFRGIETAARYLPSNAVPAVGGDWYEGLVLDGSRFAVVVGDVTGHGVAAAADMALVRGMISALLHSGIHPSDVFSQVSGVVGQRSGLLLATAALAVVDLADDTVTFATAGHPPPLLRLPDGTVQPLGTANGAMIGVSETRGLSDVSPFPVGSQLVLYTDGLVERRDQPFYVGVDRAIEHLAAVPGRRSPHELIDSLLATLVDGDKGKDDIAILVIEHTGADASL